MGSYLNNHLNNAKNTHTHTPDLPQLSSIAPRTPRQRVVFHTLFHPLQEHRAVISAADHSLVGIQSSQVGIIFRWSEAIRHAGNKRLPGWVDLVYRWKTYISISMTYIILVRFLVDLCICIRCIYDYMYIYRYMYSYISAIIIFVWIRFSTVQT